MFGFPIRSDTNGAVQPRNMARGMKFWIWEVEGLYYLCSKNKSTDQLSDTVQQIYAFEFAYAESKFYNTAVGTQIALASTRTFGL